jgi:hypothetical protein
VHSERIPRPLQSEAYLLRQYQTDLNALDVTNIVRQWKARTRIFTMDDPPHYRAILSESSLRRMPGGRLDLIFDQAEHLLDLMRRYDRLTLRIVTFDADIPFFDTDFVVLRFDGDERDFAYIEGPAGARNFRAAGDVATFVETWEQLRDAALSRDETMRFLDDVAKSSRATWRAARDDP